MRLEARKYLADIQAATERIARFTEGKRFADDAKLPLDRRAQHLVGEALSRLAKDSPEVIALIPDHAKIIGFRNILVHGYAAVDDRIVWGVVEIHLAPLRKAVAQLLAAP